MQRPIADFDQDEEAHWRALLSCGHRQHVRHLPPLSERPWVLTEAGRRERLGSPLACTACDRGELPEGFEPYKRTPEFTEDTIPAGLRRSHTTRRGVWARIHVLEGRLQYHREDEDAAHTQVTLTPDAPGVVLPEVPHHVLAVEPVRFFVEFWRASRSSGDPGRSGSLRASNSSTDRK